MALPAPPPYEDDISDQKRPPLPAHPPRSSVNKIRPVPPVPPISPSPSIASDTEQPMSHGTSDEYVEKQLLKVMDALHIKPDARGAMFEMSKPQKLTMIQQYSRQQKRAQSSSAVSPKHIQVPPPLVKHISSPMLSSETTASPSLSGQSTITLEEARRKLLQRSKTPEQLYSSSSSSNTTTTDAKQTLNELLMRSKASSHKKRSTLPPPNPLQLAKSAPLHEKRKTMPPPVPASIQQKYARHQQYESEEHKLQQVDCNSSDDNNGNDDDEFEENAADDDEYEYYEPGPPQPASPAMPLVPPQPPSPGQQKEQKKKVSVKVKLRIGSEVQVYSASRNGWVDGKICKIKKNLICVKYGGGTKKWLEANSKNFRPKLPGLVRKSGTSDAHDTDAQIDDAAVDSAQSRVRNSIAFKQKRAVKVKLKIGSEVEVFSASQNEWVDGKLTAIKKGVIKVAYGPGMKTQKWLKADSKMFRPRLHNVEQAMHAQQQQQQNTAGNNDDAKLYEIMEHEIIEQLPPPVPTFVMHDMRREQYVAQSVEAIMGRNNIRGDLKVKVNGALQLRHDANYASVKVAEHTLKTRKLSSDPNPVWKEVLTFSNFRPHIGKTANITVYNKGLMGEKCVGSAEFELPIVFGTAEKMTIDLADAKNKLSGIIVLEQVVVEKGK